MWSCHTLLSLPVIFVVAVVVVASEYLLGELYFVCSHGCPVLSTFWFVCLFWVVFLLLSFY